MGIINSINEIESRVWDGVEALTKRIKKDDVDS